MTPPPDVPGVASGWQVFVAAAAIGAVGVGLASIWIGGLPYGSFEEAMAADGTEMVPRLNATNVSVEVLSPETVTGLASGRVEVHALVYNRTGPTPIETAASFGEICSRTGCETTKLPHHDFGLYVAEKVPVQRDGSSLRVLVTTPDGQQHLHFDPP